jgi:hypothetical protein
MRERFAGTDVPSCGSLSDPRLTAAPAMGIVRAAMEFARDDPFVRTAPS